ncbi:hypothetical protein [Methylomonas rhizoryzae]|uniref:hypothetical protein n=1 Tax=Methylomonas rhizoryzae TaxID=2608981 RepID=UPI0012318906|nr:hypothetical protein [Methylomonas rhizoryzae]
MNLIQILKALLSVVIICNISFAFAESNSKSKKRVRGIHKPIQLVIAASNKDDDNLERGIYFFKIHCALESCSVERISLNECANDKNGNLSFTPAVYTWASWAGFLEADLNGNVLDLTIFQGTHRQLPAKMELELDFSNAQAVQLKSFKATGFIDFKKWPDTDNWIEYVPLKGDQTKQLNCPVFLPGISSEKK